MKPMIHRELELEAVRHVCRNMRELDAKEAYALQWSDCPDALAESVVESWGPYGFVVWDGKTEADPGEPVVIIGATETWPGCWSVWMLATDKFDSIGLSLTKWIRRRMIPQLFDELGLRRGEARSIEGHTTAHRWMLSMGATREGVLREYGKNGEDFVVFVWNQQGRRDVHGRKV